MRRQTTIGHNGFVTVEVEASESILESVPRWVDTRSILDAAFAEYERQRLEAKREEEAEKST